MRSREGHTITTVGVHCQCWAAKGTDIDGIKDFRGNVLFSTTDTLEQAQEAFEERLAHCKVPLPLA